MDTTYSPDSLLYNTTVIRAVVAVVIVCMLAVLYSIVKQYNEKFKGVPLFSEENDESEEDSDHSES